MFSFGRFGSAVVLGLLMLPVTCAAMPPEYPFEGSNSAIASASKTGEVEDGLIASEEPGWPQWRGRRRDEVSDETDLAATWPQGGPPLRWKIGGLGYGWSSPIVVGDRLYITGDIGDDLVIFAFDLGGKPIWRTTNGQSWAGPYHGARACCCYSEGKLYHMNAHGRTACFDAATGEELWAVNILDRFGGKNITWAISECLLVDGPRLLVTPGGEKALMAALDKNSGRTAWTTEPLGEDCASHSSPVLFRHASRRIVANCSSAHGFGVDADSGRLLWTVPLRSPYKVNVTPPVYHRGRIFYVTAYVFGACYQLRPTEAGFQAEKAWKTSLDTCTGSVLLVGGLLYGSGYEKHRSWLCMDWDSGRTRYEFKGLTTGAGVYAEGRLYCLAQDGRAAILQPSAEKCEIGGQFRLVAENVSDAWAHPVLLDGRLYLRYHDTLWCYDLRPK